MYQRKTILKKPPITRKLCERVNEMEKQIRGLKALIPQIEDAELEARAFMKASEVRKGMVKEPDVVKQAHDDRDSLDSLFEEGESNGA